MAYILTLGSVNNMNTKQAVSVSFSCVLFLPIIFLWYRSSIDIAISHDESKTPHIVNMLSCDAPFLSDTTVDILVVIMSDSKNFNKRAYLRSTWACQNDILPAIRFFVGKSNQESVNKDLEEEAEHFQDVCIMDVADNYETLPIKVCQIFV